MRHEHERWDGSGYPDGLAGEEIPLASRIVLACDAFNALVSDRPYRRALRVAEAVAELERCAGTQFDPAVVARAARLPPRRRRRRGRRGRGRPRRSPRTARERRRRPAARARAARADHDRLGGRGRGRASTTSSRSRPTRHGSPSAPTRSRSRGGRRDARVLRVIVNTRRARRRGRSGGRPTRCTRSTTTTRSACSSSRAVVHDLARRPGGVRREAELLRQIGKHSCVAVPIMLGGSAWGELWAARASGHAGVRRHATSASSRRSRARSPRPSGAPSSTRGWPTRVQGSADRRRQPPGARGAARALLPGGARERRRRGRAARRSRQPQGAQRRARPRPRRPGARRGRAGAHCRDGQAAGDDRTVYRLGGDEFCLLLAHGTAEEARLAGERAIASLARSVRRPSPPRSASPRSGSGQDDRQICSAPPTMRSTSRSARAATVSASPIPSHDAVWDGSREVTARRARRRVRAGGSPDPANAPASALEILDGELARGRPVPALQAIVARRSATPSMPHGLRSRSRPVGRDLITTYWTVNLRAGRTWSKGPGAGGDDYDDERLPADRADPRARRQLRRQGRRPGR